jgi:hypothetical protein
MYLGAIIVWIIIDTAGSKVGRYDYTKADCALICDEHGLIFYKTVFEANGYVPAMCVCVAR